MFTSNPEQSSADWLVFTNLPPVSFWFGAPLVVGAGLLIAWREHRLGLARRALAEPKEA